MLTLEKICLDLDLTNSIGHNTGSYACSMLSCVIQENLFLGLKSIPMVLYKCFTVWNCLICDYKKYVSSYSISYLKCNYGKHSIHSMAKMHKISKLNNNKLDQ